MDTSFEVPDSTDWLLTPLAGLARVEASLRCQVCKDFFNTPMITSCSHTFCSLCIRRCLSNDGKCPACRTGEQEIKLRRNWAVQEVADAFKSGRESMLQFAMGVPVPEAEWKSATKRKLDDTQPDDHLDARSAQVRKTRSKSRIAESTLAIDQEVLEDERDADYAPEDGLVACPVCASRMKEQDVFLHLDSCASAKPSSLSHPSRALSSQQNDKVPFPGLKQSNPSPPPSRLPTIPYDLVKEKDLRKKLRDLKIPDWGVKSLLIRRHIEYLNLHNANCDSPRPKSKRELLLELDVWERTQGGNAPLSGTGHAPGSVGKKDFDAQAWSRGHDDNFKKLIADARKNRKASEKAETGETAVTNRAEIDTNEPVKAETPKPRAEDVIMDSQESSTPLDNLDDVARGTGREDEALDLTTLDQVKEFDVGGQTRNAYTDSSPRRRPIFEQSPESTAVAGGR